MKVITLFLIFVFVSCFIPSRAQDSLVKQWQVVYGGSEDDIVTGACATNDGGCLVVGYSGSNNYNVSGNHGGYDVWVTKLDAYGNLAWQKCYGTNTDDYPRYIIPANDGCFVIAGHTYLGYQAVGYVLKINQDGDELWSKLVNIPNSDIYLQSIRQTADGGFVCGGQKGMHAFIAGLNSTGDMQWNKTYQETSGSASYCKDITVTDDNGFLLLSSANVKPAFETADYQIKLTKTDAQGNMVWQSYYGGPEEQYPMRLLALEDGDHLLVSDQFTLGGNFTNMLGQSQGWVVRVDESGGVVWNRYYGPESLHYFTGAGNLADGNIVLSGCTNEVNSSLGAYDFWKLVINPSGDIISEEFFGGTGAEESPVPVVLSNNDIVIAGTSNSSDQYVTGNHGLSDFLIVKQCSPSPLSITSSGSPFCESTTLTAAGGFQSWQWNTGDTTQYITVSQSSSYHLTAINASGCPSEAEITVERSEPYDLQVCMVINPQAPVIIAEWVPDSGIDSVYFYRFNSKTGNSTRLYGLRYSHGAYIIDHFAEPGQSHQYCVTATDATCHHESNLSVPHKTMLLQGSKGLNNEVNLSWNPYEGFEYPVFRIYRKVGNGDFTHIADVPSNTYTFTDVNPPSGDKEYQLLILKDEPCFGLGMYQGEVYSNVIQTSTLGIREDLQNTISLYPNPATGQVCLREDNNHQTTFRYTIYSLEGLKLMEGTTESCIDISGLKAGSYLIKMGEDWIGRFVKM